MINCGQAIKFNLICHYPCLKMIIQSHAIMQVFSNEGIDFFVILIEYNQT